MWAENLEYLQQNLKGEEFNLFLVECGPQVPRVPVRSCWESKTHITSFLFSKRMFHSLLVALYFEILYLK